MGIPVLDGLFLGKLKKFEDSSRLTEEEYFKKIDDYALSKIDGDWRGRMQTSKSLLAKGLSFDSCNEWLLNGRFFAEQVITKPNQREVALKSLYLICSYIAIAIDYILREYSFLEQAERSTLIKDGFSYGSKGSSGFKKILNVTMGLVEQHAKDGLLISKQVRSSVDNQLATSNAEILGDFFSKNEVAKTLFTVAKELEALAMQRNFLSHATSSVELRSLLMCLIDFWVMDRVLFLIH